MHLKWQQNYFTSSSSWIWNTVKREWNLIRSNLRKSDLKHETMCPFSSPGSFGTHGKSSAEWKTLERNHQLLSQMNTDTVLALKVCWEQTPFIVRKQRKRHKVEQQIMRNNQRYFYTKLVLCQSNEKQLHSDRQSQSRVTRFTSSWDDVQHLWVVTVFQRTDTSDTRS